MTLSNVIFHHIVDYPEVLVRCTKVCVITHTRTQMKARCALSLGYLSVGDPLFPLKRTVLEGLFQGREEKALDLQFTIGEALACTAAGSFCSSSLDLWRLSDNKEERFGCIHV